MPTISVTCEMVQPHLDIVEALAAPPPGRREREQRSAATGTVTVGGRSVPERMGGFGHRGNDVSRSGEEPVSKARSSRRIRTAPASRCAGRHRSRW